MESLAVKYRPQTFGDVVGQENVLTILMNQLKQDMTKQGYLFTGGAGTGKTTIARIFARELNGIDINGRADIIEIDAASNNGVESIREIRESVKYKPISSKFKVYIIDEVHMVSTGGFNALLKTLEEPPPHAVFILCTTDPHKIPATILSRVQRFDFKRMTVDQIMGRLSHIIDNENIEKISSGSGSQDAIADLEWAKKEGIPVLEVDDGVLEYIAKLANGGMRNSISLLDTVLGYSHSPTINDVFEILGVQDFEEFLNILSSIHTGNKADVLQKLESLHLRGKDLKRFIIGLTEFIVDLQKVSLLQNYDFVQIPSNYFDRVDKAVTFIGYEKLGALFLKLSDLSNRMKYETNPKVMIQGELLNL